MSSRIIGDWIFFCEGSTDFDKYHFHTLFFEDCTQDDLKEIFKYFPSSNQLYDLTNDYLFRNNDEINNDLYEELIALALKDVEQKKELMLQNNNIIKVIEELKVEFVLDINTVLSSKKSKPFIDFFNIVSDRFLNDWIIKDKKTFALFEAFYGLTNSYEMVWYLFQPLTTVKINLGYYYNFTNLGGVYSLDSDRLLVSRYS